MSFDPIVLDFENGRTGYSVIQNNEDDSLMSATFTVNSTCEAALSTCLGALSGVSIQYDNGTLQIRVIPPFDSAQLDKAKAAVRDIDPTAIES